MPLDRFVLLLVIVIAAAGVTIWVAGLVLASLQLPAAGWALFVPAFLLGYVAWRVIAERLRNREDDYYDRIEK